MPVLAEVELTSVIDGGGYRGAIGLPSRRTAERPQCGDARRRQKPPRLVGRAGAHRLHHGGVRGARLAGQRRRRPDPGDGDPGAGDVVDQLGGDRADHRQRHPRLGGDGGGVGLLRRPGQPQAAPAGRNRHLGDRGGAVGDGADVRSALRLPDDRRRRPGQRRLDRLLGDQRLHLAAPPRPGDEPVGALPGSRRADRGAAGEPAGRRRLRGADARHRRPRVRLRPPLHGRPSRPRGDGASPSCATSTTIRHSTTATPSSPSRFRC